MAVKGVYEVLDFFINGKSPDAYTPYYFTQGLSFLTLASSMYVKEIDPSILNKKSLWEKTCNWFNEKLSRPELVPVPVEECSTLENYVVAQIK